jgi:hypothetical protein
MSYHFTHVRRYKRGTKWADGEAVTCTRCRVEKLDEVRGRARRAVVTALIRTPGSRFRTPVAYCAEHLPEALVEAPGS